MFIPTTFRSTWTIQNPNNAQFLYCSDRFCNWELWHERRYTRDINPLTTEINLHYIQFVPHRERLVLQLVRPFGHSRCALADNYLTLIG